jgi:fatty-acyl-CoA synthase
MGWSYAHGTSEVPLRSETIGDALALTAARLPAADALISRHQGVRLTYGQLDEQVDRLARALMAAGIARGDRIGIWSPNCVEWVLVQYAAARIGAILVNLNPAYRTSEIAYALKQSGCRLLVSAPLYRTSDYRAMLDEVAPGLEALERTVFIGTGDWDALLAQADATSEAALRERSGSLQFDDPINIQYTSGTTGSPKGATLSHHNILNNGFFVGELCRLGEADRIAVPVPLYHCFGMVMGNLAAVTHGSCLVYPEAAFDARSCLEAVAHERCTALYGVPTMFIAQLALPDFADYDLSSLRSGIMAGSPCPVEVMRRVIADMHMDEVTICYGMTETSPVSTQTAPDDPLERRVATVGRVHPHVEVKIVDPDSGAIVPHGESGELCTRAYSVMLGYWEDRERTEEAIDRARWMHTGDLATMDDEGYLNIVGRIKDMIIRGGENVYPREIEEFLYTHPEVTDASVIGVPDARYGEEIMAWVQLREGATVDDEGLRDFCRGAIAQYKVPRYVKVVEGFPMTVTGKVQKFVMRDQAIEELELQEATTA